MTRHQFLISIDKDHAKQKYEQILEILAIVYIQLRFNPTEHSILHTLQTIDQKHHEVSQTDPASVYNELIGSFKNSLVQIIGQSNEFKILVLENSTILKEHKLDNAKYVFEPSDIIDSYHNLNLDEVLPVTIAITRNLSSFTI